jgi:type IV pilus assembly protein PilB
MHWLAEAAARSGIEGATSLLIPAGTVAAEAWEMTARALGVTPSDLAQRTSRALGLHYADFQAAQRKATRLVPAKLARRFNVFPLREDDRQLIVATADPQNLECEHTLGFAAGRRIRFELAAPHQVADAVIRGYAVEQSMEHAIDDLDDQLADAVQVLEELKPEVVAVQEVEAAPIVRLTNLVLRDAVLQRASDVHVEPGDRIGLIRFRIDGVMRQHLQLPMAALNRVVSRIKVLSRLDIADRLRPQDGRTRIQVEGKTYDLRVSTVPIRDSEKAVIRVLRPSASNTLSSVGLADVERDQLRKLLAHRDGIVFVTGPTGSGKTTTLYGALGDLCTGESNITTVEDPVEYELPGVAQIQVDPKRGVTFASALRAILRQDPDVIFVGEIRDLETAEIAVQAAMTGHLVLATLHTNDAIGAIARLEDIGVERTRIAATLRGAVAQRLVRRVCDECALKITGELTQEEARLAEKYGVRPLVRAVGCARCANTGYYGRVPINELASFTPALAELVAQGATAAALQRAAIASGMRPLRITALERVARRETTLSEIERVIGDTADAVPANAPSQSVLVVDDDEVERLLVTSVLEKSGFRVEQAPDGSAALEQIASAPSAHALVVTDISMPKMDGDEFIRRLRQDPKTSALPVIVLTGSEDDTRESELIDAGADDYIRKPLDPSKLVARVRAALRRVAAA